MLRRGEERGLCALKGHTCSVRLYTGRAVCVCGLVTVAHREGEVLHGVEARWLGSHLMQQFSFFFIVHG